MRCLRENVSCLTCADEEHVVGLVDGLHSVHGDLRVAHVALEQEGRAADHAVHQEVVLDEVQHLVRHVQRGGDAHAARRVGDALWETERRRKRRGRRRRRDINKE